MAFEDLFWNPRLRLLAEAPDFDEIVATRAREPFHALHRGGLLTRDSVARLGDDERARLDGGRPGHSVAPDGVSFEDGCVPITIVYAHGRLSDHCYITALHNAAGRRVARTLEGEDGDGPVRGCASENRAKLVRCPRDRVDWS